MKNKLSAVARSLSLRDLLIAGMAVFLFFDRVAPAVRARAEGEPADIAAAESRAVTSFPFTFQGRIEKDGLPADGPHLVEISYWDAAVNGNSVGVTTTFNNVPVANGLFTVTTTIHASEWNGSPRWVQVRAAPEGEALVLVGRQQVTATPYALMALNVASHSHYADAWSGSTATNGLYVRNDSEGIGSSAIFGETKATYGAGVNGFGSDGGVGVSGTGTHSYGTADRRGIGVVGRSFDPVALQNPPYQDAQFYDSGVYGESVERIGVAGFSGNYVGVWGQGPDAGVLGQGAQVGVWGRSTGGGYAGYFEQRIKVFGNIEYTGVLVPPPSDARLKHDIQALPEGLAAVLALRPLKYAWNETPSWEDAGHLHNGFLAQEVQEVLPSAVYDVDGTLRLSYDELIPVLVNAIQEQQRLIEELQAR